MLKCFQLNFKRVNQENSKDRDNFERFTQKWTYIKEKSYFRNNMSNKMEGVTYNTFF